LHLANADWGYSRYHWSMSWVTYNASPSKKTNNALSQKPTLLLTEKHQLSPTISFISSTFWIQPRQNILGRLLENCTSVHMINTRSLSCGSVNGWHGLPMPTQSRYITCHLNFWGLRLNNPKNNLVRQVHLHCILSTTSLAPNCLSLWEWCIVVIGNGIHWYQHDNQQFDKPGDQRIPSSYLADCRIMIKC
jgi:hypothetical protein